MVRRFLLHSKGQERMIREPQSNTPEGRGGGGGRLIAIEAIGIAFVVHAVGVFFLFFLVMARPPAHPVIARATKSGPG
jgi:hypothetical protein